MDAVFLKLVELSIIGSLFILAVILLRLIFKKAPKWVFCLLWGLAAVRLILPVSIESNFSLVPDNVSEKQIISQMEQSYVGDITYIQEGTENYQAAVDAGRKPIPSGKSFYVVTQKDSLEEPETVKTAVLPVVSRIWFAGMITMLGYTLVSYLALRRKVSTATRLKRNVKQSECVDSPFVLGLFRPVIYLPYGIDDLDRENVIAHEQAHIQRKDHWWKPIGFLLLSVYWFNPVMWLAYILLCRDIEGACDEKVIKQLDMDGVRAYSTALLNCSVHRRSIAACPLAFGEVGVKERIKRVMHYKKPALWIVLLALVASAVAAVLLLTTPRGDEQLLMGAYYEAAELLYTNKQEETEVFSRFGITADYKLLTQKQGNNTWNLNRQMEKYPLTAEELAACTDYDNGWHRPYNITKIEDAYILRVENNYFYLAAKTESGDTLLGFGEANPEGNPGDSSLRYLYRLESEFKPGEVDLDFLTQSLLWDAGIVNIIEVWESEENPGFLVAGLVSGYQYSAASDYDDMGYAVFQTDGTGYRLLECKMYEDVLYEENSIFVCPDPIVLSLDGEMKENVTFDLILSWNEDLAKVQREYYKGDERIHSIASIQNGKSSMHLFRWDAASSADTVTQVFLDKDGKELPVKTTEEILLGLVQQIASNPSVAASSNPYDYIKARQELFDRILSYGDTAVNYLLNSLYNSTEDGLVEYIMAAACAEITGIGKDKSDAHWFSGKHWLHLYEGSSILGKYEDQVGGSIGVDSLLGIDRVWMKCVDIQPHAYMQGVFYHNLRFYYYGDGKDYDTRGQEKYLLEVHGCLDYRMKDFDGDGIVELFVCTEDPYTPYELYDLIGTQIVAEKFALVPDAVMDYEMLLDAEEYYLYEERWAWFLKDPAAYVSEVAKRSEDRLYSICPNGIIPAHLDTDLIDNAIAKLHALLDGTPTAYEKKIIYKLLNTIQLSYVPEQLEVSDIHYERLLEQWCYTTEKSTEAYNCLQQISDVFDADPVAFLKGVAAVEKGKLSKDLQPVISWLVNTNYLYHANAFQSTLRQLHSRAVSGAEKELAEQFQKEMDAQKVPAMDAEKLMKSESADLWCAFFYDPEKVLRSLGDCNAEQLKPLGQKLWGIEQWPEKLLDKGYAAVNGILSEKPTGALKDVVYKFLIHLEWEGGYRDEYISGQPVDYQRLFDKLLYSDGALTSSAMSQLYPVYDADPSGFIRALTQWSKQVPERNMVENIASNFAYQYADSDSYLRDLQELAGKMAEAEEQTCVSKFMEAYQKARENS